MIYAILSVNNKDTNKTYVVTGQTMTERQAIEKCIKLNEYQQQYLNGRMYFKPITIDSKEYKEAMKI